MNVQAIMDFFNKFIDTISMELQFVIDNISEADSSAVGVTWHLGMLKDRFSVLSDFHTSDKFLFSTFKATNGGNDNRMEGEAFSI